jgi:hypothetical protein
VALERGPERLDRRRSRVLDFEHGVRIAERHGADLVAGALDLDFVALGRALGRERDARRLELGHAHVEPHAGVGEPLGRDHRARRLQPHRATGPLAVPVQPGDHAACAVAALAGGAAVLVPHAVAEHRARTRRLLDREQLIEPDPAPPVRHAPDRLGRERRIWGAPIQHGEVVADAVHLAEANRHQRPDSGAFGASCFFSADFFCSCFWPSALSGSTSGPFWPQAAMPNSRASSTVQRASARVIGKLPVAAKDRCGPGA